VTAKPPDDETRDLINKVHSSWRQVNGLPPLADHEAILSEKDFAFWLSVANPDAHQTTPLIAHDEALRKQVADLAGELETVRRDLDAALELCGQVQEWYTAYRRKYPAAAPEPTVDWRAINREQAENGLPPGLQDEEGRVLTCPTCGSTDRAVLGYDCQYLGTSRFRQVDAWHSVEELGR